MSKRLNDIAYARIVRVVNGVVQYVLSRRTHRVVHQITYGFESDLDHVHQQAQAARLVKEHEAVEQEVADVAQDIPDADVVGHPAKTGVVDVRRYRLEHVTGEHFIDYPDLYLFSTIKTIYGSFTSSKPFHFYSFYDSSFISSILCIVIYEKNNTTLKTLRKTSPFI